MSSFDLAEYLDLFKEDVAEHLQRMTSGLLALETDPNDRAPLDDLFRSAHTIKGSARMLSLDAIATLAHRMEDVLSAFRAGQLAPSPEHVSTLLSALDLLKRMVDTTSPGEQQVPAEHDQTLDCLASVLKQPPGNQATVASAELREPARPETASSPPVVAYTAQSQSTAPHDATLLPAQAARVQQRDYMRVPVAKVDRLLNLAGELVVRRGQGRRHVEALKDLAEQARAVRDLLARGEATGARLAIEQVYKGLEAESRVQWSEAAWQSELTQDLHGEVAQLRMLPLSNVFALFPRTVRDLSLQRGKEAQLLTEGGEIEIDKLILDGIREPLLHLVRNAVDHGLEEPEARQRAGKPRIGSVRLAARQRGDRVEVSVADDGRGLDLERIRRLGVARGLLAAHQAGGVPEQELLALVFVPGFSTSEQITETSGRGVGMDIVRAAVAALDGQISLQSRPAEGTTCTISLPLTLAHTRVLLVAVADQTFALPSASVEQVASIGAHQIAWLQGRAAVEVGGRTLPLLALSEVLGLATAPLRASEHKMVVARSGGQRVAFAVDALLGEEDIVAKSLGPMLRGARFVSAGAILADGRIALLANVSSIIHGVGPGAATRPAPVPPAEPEARRRVLVVDDTSTTRELERAILAAAGYEVETAVDGLDALERLALGDYQAVVTDIEMPRMDGFELTQALRRDDRYRHVPVVVVTTRERQEDRQRGLEAGAQAYLLKSAFDQQSLLEVLERLVG